MRRRRGIGGRRSETPAHQVSLVTSNRQRAIHRRVPAWSSSLVIVSKPAVDSCEALRITATMAAWDDFRGRSWGRCSRPHSPQTVAARPHRHIVPPTPPRVAAVAPVRGADRGPNQTLATLTAQVECSTGAATLLHATRPARQL